jgi:ribonuclease R
MPRISTSALSLKRLKNGNWEVGVHIADVAHYLKPGTVLDEEARQRATSVYLVDRTIPMLPEVLSNNLCSLRPNEDRLAFSAVFEMNDKAEIKGEWFGRSVIHSDQRFAYHEAQERIETGKGKYADEVNTLQHLAVQLRANRFKAGGIDFNTEEVKFELDEAGKPLRVVIKRMLDANRLIEDFMLLANVRVSRYLAKPRTTEGKREEATRTAVYRIHDKPDPEKLQQLRKFVAKFGLEMPKISPANAESGTATIATSSRRQHRRKRGQNDGDSFHGQGRIQHQQHWPLRPRVPVLHPLHEPHPPVPRRVGASVVAGIH